MFHIALPSFYKKKKNDREQENKGIVLKIVQLSQNGNGYFLPE